MLRIIMLVLFLIVGCREWPTDPDLDIVPAVRPQPVEECTASKRPDCIVPDSSNLHIPTYVPTLPPSASNDDA